MLPPFLRCARHAKIAPLHGRGLENDSLCTFTADLILQDVNLTMPARAADAGHAAFRFTQRDIFHQAGAGLAGGTDIGQPVNQQYPAQLLTAAAQHFHRHRPAAALSPRIFPLQQSPEVTAIGIAGDCRHAQRVTYFDVLDLRLTVALYLLFIPEIFPG